jgi:hypothetical protein
MLDAGYWMLDICSRIASVFFTAEAQGSQSRWHRAKGVY